LLFRTYAHNAFIHYLKMMHACNDF